MTCRISMAAAVLFGVCSLAMSGPMVDGGYEAAEMWRGPDAAERNGHDGCISKVDEPILLHRDSNTGQFYVSTGEFQHGVQSSFPLADVDQRAVLEFILDEWLRDPNDAGPEMPPAGGGGAPSTNSLFASNGDAGYGSALPLMAVPTATNHTATGPVTTNRQFAAAPVPVSDIIVTPSPGGSTEGSAPIPEPATFVLLAGGAAMLRRRKRNT